MTGNLWRSTLILLATAACAGSRPSRPVSPSPAPTQPSAEVSDNGPWIFAYTSDTIRLQINRSAAIESQTDSGTHREISTNNTHEILALAVSADTVRYTATIDTFSTASQGLISGTPPVNLPVQISGAIDSVTVAADSSALEPCDAVQSSLKTDIRNVLISFPRQLAPGMTWRDSTVRVSCYGTIPMRATIVRRFSVVGKTSFNGEAVVTIQRVDSITAQGAGRQQQHQMVIETIGSGTATYFVSPELGRLLRLTTTQDLDFIIRASGRTNRMRETAKEEFNRVR
ncbi:MAG: hypothetical protein ACJ8AK_05020 [Gemmatimonadaceae bacterium]